jgi:ABC-type phosphate transport system substrate-binding protein
MSHGIHRADALTCRNGWSSPLLRSILNAAAALLLTATFIVGQARADTLVVQGSTTLADRLIVPKQRQIEALSGQSLKVVPTRSDVGILRLFFGGSELAMISTSLANEIAFLRRDYPDLAYDRLHGFAVGRTRVALAVNPTNPVRDIDAAQLRRILSGEITNWRQVGGSNLPVRVVFVAGGDGVTLSVARTALDDSAIKTPDTIRVQKPIQVIQVVKEEAAALGIAQLHLTRNHQLRDVANGTPVEQELNLVTLGEPTPAARAVIEAVQRTAASMQ